MHQLRRYKVICFCHKPKVYFLSAAITSNDEYKFKEKERTIRKFGQIVLRWQLPVVLIIAGLTFLFSLRLTDLKIEDDTDMWFSPDDPVFKTYEEFRDEFPSDEFNLISFETKPPLNENEFSYLLELEEVLEAVADIDGLLSFSEETPRRIISAILPDILVKGGDWKPDQVVGREEVEAAGGEVVIIPFLPDHSSSDIIERIIRLSRQK